MLNQYRANFKKKEETEMNSVEIALVALMVGIVIWMAWQHAELRNLKERTKDTFSRVQGIINKERSGK